MTSNYKDNNCDLTADRDHFLGDIYHSQLVEVAAPSASTSTSQNQEAFFRAKNSLPRLFASVANRKPIIYAGGNDGMLHAFNACKGYSDVAEKEEWAFVPPFIG